jgi:uncharacterized membrane protein
MASPRAEGGISPSDAHAHRSTLGTAALALTALSVTGFIVMVIGSIADWKGFSEDPGDTSTFADLVWSTFALSGLLALVTGIAAWLLGRQRNRFGDVRAGQVAIGWVVLAIVVSLIVTALE